MSLLISVHVAQTLDGRLGIEGTRTTLSTSEGREAAHVARAESDAVLVGINTVRIDDPMLTVRHLPPDFPPVGKDPLRVVLASRLDVPLTARVLVARGKVLVIGAKGRPSSAEAREQLLALGADVEIVAATPDGRVSIEGALEVLASRGVKNLLVEGGARVLTSFFRARLVHRVTMELAASFLGAAGTPMLGALGMMPVKLTNLNVDRLGAHILVRGDVVFGETDE